jgi:5-methylcytosine-specific restriction endonuclease McrA
MEERICDCHGEPMRPIADARYTDGIHWRCRVKHREYERKRRQTNPPTAEQYAEKARRFRASHPDYDREWREKNKERVNEQNRAWQARQHPDKWREMVERRRARRRGLPSDDHTRREIWERDLGLCVYCGEPADPSSWHLAHLIALSDPRTDNPGTVRSNVAVSHPSCNLHAGTSPVGGAAACSRTS